MAITEDCTNLLRKIHNNAADIMQHPRLSIYATKWRHSPVEANSNFESVFHPPRPIASALISRGVEASLSQRLSDTYVKAAEEFKVYCEGLLRRTCAELIPYHQLALSIPISEVESRISSAYASQYNSMLNTWFERVIAASQTSQKAPCEKLTSANPRHSFNNEYIPLLEKYFEANAFPSHADKTVLARKSMMTYRQIDVWFQNRRSRTRKEGKTLQKLPMHQAPPFSLDSLEKDMRDFVIPKEERVDPVDSDTSEFELEYSSDEDDRSSSTSIAPQRQDEPNQFQIQAPPHAFPTTYPPPAEHNAFPADGKFVFQPPTWRRHPAQSPVNQPPMIDFDEFVDKFKQLNVRQGCRKHLVKKVPQDPSKPAKPRRTQTPPPKPDQSAATIAITTIAPSAPLPSLICLRPITQITPPLPLPTRPISSSSRRRTHSPSPQPPPIPLIAATPPVPSTHKPPRRRKVAPLPKRPAPAAVSSQPTLASTPNPPTSRRPPSRSPSFESDCSSHASSSTLSSSEISTPLFSPAIFPSTLPAPSKANFDFSVRKLLRGSQDGSLSPEHGIPVELPPATDPTGGVAKQPFSFTFGAPMATLVPNNS